MDTSTPASPPATFATWFRVSETENVDDLISSPISRPTIESWLSLARLAQKIEVNMTTTDAHRPNVQAHAAVTTGAIASTANMIRCGERPRKNEPSTIDARLPSDRPAAAAASAKLCDTEWPMTVPRFTLRSTNTSRKRT
jgi:hypothetical protein